jgi:UDP-2-acetamido-2,6-beta-L-arabino-hexul-4-ose reductase
LKIGITGQVGFIGTHLYNYLAISKYQHELIPFHDDYFDNQEILTGFVEKCDCIVHLAALNRHNDPEKIYSTNIELVDKLLAALKQSNSKAHIVFASSIQEERDNVYGRSKKAGRLKLADWAVKNNSGFTGLVIPNVFGPFGRPFYNSALSTFSYQVVNYEQPKIEIDAELNLIYVGDLCGVIEQIILNKFGKINEYYSVPHSFSNKVSVLMQKITDYGKVYLKNGIIPSLENRNEVNLFNTFRSYIDSNKFFPFKYVIHEDERGNFSEIMKSQSGGQVSFSTTKPGITRGNHFHTRKIERFAVIKGEALIQPRKFGTSEIIELRLSGKDPSFVDMPIWYTHNIKNIGNDDLYTIFWINEFYDPQDPDTYFEKV